MKKEYEYIEEEFDEYLDGGMAKKERAAFEARLAADPALQEEFTFHQSIRDGLLKNSIRVRQKKEIGEIRRKMLLRRGRFRFWTIFLAVFTLLLLLAVGCWYFTFQPHELEQENPPTNSLEENVAFLEETAEPSKKGQEPNAEQKRTGPETLSSPQRNRERHTIENEFPAGSRNDKKSINGNIEIKKLVVENGGAVPGFGERSIQVEIRFDQELQNQVPKYSFFDKKLKVFTSRPNDFSPDHLEMIELEQLGSPNRLFLRSEKKWYLVINDGETRYLLPVTDEDILHFLK